RPRGPAANAGVASACPSAGCSPAPRHSWRLQAEVAHGLSHTDPIPRPHTPFEAALGRHQQDHGGTKPEHPQLVATGQVGPGILVLELAARIATQVGHHGGKAQGNSPNAHGPYENRRHLSQLPMMLLYDDPLVFHEKLRNV